MKTGSFLMCCCQGYHYKVSYAIHTDNEALYNSSERGMKPYPILIDREAIHWQSVLRAISPWTIYRNFSEISAALGISATIINLQNNYRGISHTPDPSIDYIYRKFSDAIHTDNEALYNSSEHGMKPYFIPIDREAILTVCTESHIAIDCIRHV